MWSFIPALLLDRTTALAALLSLLNVVLLLILQRPCATQFGRAGLSDALLLNARSCAGKTCRAVNENVWQARPQWTSQQRLQWRTYQDVLITETAQFRPEPSGRPGGSNATRSYFAFWLPLWRNGSDVGDRINLPIYWWDVFWDPEAKPGVIPFMDSLDRQYRYYSVIWLDKALRLMDYEVPPWLDIILFTSGSTQRGARNVHVPALYNELSSSGQLQRDIPVSFVGSMHHHKTRERLMEMWGNEPLWHFAPPFVENPEFKDSYQGILERSVYCLCPRGHGATTFRVYEAIQLGAIPIYIWAFDLHLPFQELVDWNEIAVVINQYNLPLLKERLAAFDVPRAQAALGRLRHLFSYDYTNSYILRRLRTEATFPVPRAASGDQFGRETFRNYVDVNEPH